MAHSTHIFFTKHILFIHLALVGAQEGWLVFKVLKSEEQTTKSTLLDLPSYYNTVTKDIKYQT